MRIETQRLIIRPPETGDLPEIIALHADPEVMRHITDGRPDDPERLEKDMLPRWMEYLRKYDGWGFLVAQLHSGEFVGWFHLLPRGGGPRDYELGYRLHRRFWNCGLATEGSRALVAKLAWSNLADRVTASHMAANVASERVMRKIGMTFDCEYQESRFPGERKLARRYAIDFSTVVHRRLWLAREGLNDRVITRLPSGFAVMFDYQTLAGYVLLLSDPVYIDINAAPEAHRGQFLSDMVRLGKAVQHATGADLMNYMLLGNTDRALHAHIAPRYASEPAEIRRTGPWMYYPTHRPDQRMFDASRDRELMDRIARELSA